MYDLDDGDTDYNFSVFGGVTEDDGELPADMTENIPKVAVDLTQNHFDQVVINIDDDLISTLGNGTVNWFRPRTIGATPGIPRTIAPRPGSVPSSGFSLSDKVGLPWIVEYHI